MYQYKNTVLDNSNAVDVSCGNHTQASMLQICWQDLGTLFTKSTPSYKYGNLDYKFKIDDHISFLTGIPLPIR